MQLRPSARAPPPFWQKIVQFIMDIRQQLVAEWIDDLALLGEDDYTFLQVRSSRKRRPRPFHDI